MRVTGLFFLLLLFSCSPKIMVIKEPAVMPPARKLAAEPRVALALGGGAFHGAAHVGVLKAFAENNIHVDFIAGASAGSLVGALYCDNPDLKRLEALVVETKSSMVFDFSLLRSSMGFVSGAKLQKYVKANCSCENIEDTRIPFVAVTTDLVAGKTVPLASGPIAASVNASCAIPMVFEPVKMYGMTLVDGGVLDNVPVDICKSYNAKVVIGVDIMADIGTMDTIDTFLKVGYKSLLLSMIQNKEMKLTKADLVISPNLKNMPMMSSKQNRQIFDSGYVAAMRLMPRIKEILREKGIVIY